MTKASNGNGWIGRIILGAALAALSGGGVVAWQRNNVLQDKLTERVNLNETKIAVVETTMERIDKNVERLLERN